MAWILTLRNKTFCTVFLLMFMSGCSWVPFREKPYEPSFTDLSEIEKKLYDEFRRWQGTPYVHGGNNTKGIDCSGFVIKIYEKLFGILLPRDTIQQATMGIFVPKDRLQVGDLVFFSQYSRKINHVGIYLKNGKFIHASTSKGVMISRLDIAYWQNAYHAARRIIKP
jgi:lipoprotein Spr/probable lipoprotein NlpC